MKLSTLALGGSLLLALGAPAFAAGSAAGDAADAGSVAASKATTEVEKAVGGSDTFSQADIASQVPLSQVANAKDKLSTAKVDDMHGGIIGPVKAVMASDKGMAMEIHVDVGGWLGVGERVVAMKSSDFKYIPGRNILVISLTKSQIEQLKPVNG